MARDSQRSKCYKWDRLMARTYAQLGTLNKSWAGPGEPMTDRDQKADAQFLIRYVLSDYGIDPSKVQVKFTEQNGGACANSWMVNFTPGYISREFIYHEVCHTIIMSQPWLLDEVVTKTDVYAGVTITSTGRKTNPVRQDPGHGPIFVRLLAEVISYYEQIPIKELLDLAKQCGLRVAKATEVPQRLPEEQVKLDPKHYPAAA